MLENIIYSKRFPDKKNRNLLWKTLIKNFLQEFFDTKDVVLDVGCGYGEFINNISCYKKYALDINSDVAKFLNKDVFFLKSFSSKISIKNKIIDKIFISNFFEHITKDEIIKTIQELKRILKPDGKIIILQPNIRFCGKNYWMFFDHITPIDDRALIEAFETLGFKVNLNIEKFLPFTTKNNLPQHPVFLYIYLKLPFLWKIFGAQSLLIFNL
ncbi:MAG: class I SAM-dependent methyltransferase [Candidatus Levybacteria bacterium]|nr:class I SAM-dependent methyltransferase [Candidatus Levybacteria bacterium]